MPLFSRKQVAFAVLAIAFMAAEVLMDLLLPDAMRKLVDLGVLGIGRDGDGDPDAVLRYGLLMAGIAVSGGVFGSLNTVFTALVAQGIGNRLRCAAYRRIMALKPEAVSEFGIGTLITRMTNDVTRVQDFISRMIRGGARTTLMTAGSVAFIFGISRDFGLIVLSAIPVMALFSYLAIRRVNPLFPKLQSQMDDLNELLREDIAGLKTVKAFVREAWERFRMAKRNGKLVRTQLSILFIFALMSPVMNFVISLVVIAILWRGGVLAAEGAATPGSVLAAINYSGRLLFSILMLVMLSQSIARGRASLVRVLEVARAKGEAECGTAERGPEPPGTVEFRDAGFRWKDAREPVFSHVSLKVLPGETIALMGSTGTGKTTLVSFLPRLLEPTEGEVLLDGLPASAYSRAALKRIVAISLQKPEIFSGTIRENIAFGRSNATDAEIREAAGAAEADGFISKRPEGYATVLTEGGRELSGGERQRVALARAILQKPEVLVLDDSTSALDLATEARVLASLDEILPGTTKILVCERLATARHADRIAVLDRGTLDSFGTESELLRRSKSFREIVESQGREALP